MRDAHRMKERFDLSLDNRQVGSLLIGGIVVLGAVFVLGVVVGKKLAGNEETRQADDILSALDRKADQAPPAAEVPLTFQEELTRKQAEPVATPEPKPSAVPPISPPAVAASPEPAAESPDEPAAPERPKLSIGEGKVEQAAVPTRAAAREGGLSEAFERVAARPPAEAVKGGAFTLQLSASQSRDEADRFVKRLRDRGYAPYIVKAEVAGKGTWYRVRMGSFPSKEAAQRYLADFKRETQLSAFVAANE